MMIPTPTGANTKDIDDHVSQQTVAYLAWGKRLVPAPLAYVFFACKTCCEDLHNPWAVPVKTTHYRATIAEQVCFKYNLCSCNCVAEDMPPQFIIRIPIQKCMNEHEHIKAIIDIAHHIHEHNLAQSIIRKTN